MGNCKDCKRWDKYDMTCRIDTVYEDTDVGITSALLYVRADDDQGLTVVMKTGPWFGCSAFEAKP